jgi:AraC-like DNA-binding protein
MISNKSLNKPLVTFFQPHPDLLNCILKYSFWTAESKYLTETKILPLQTGFIDIYLHYNNSEIIVNSNNSISKYNGIFAGLFDNSDCPLINISPRDKLTKWVNITFNYCGLRKLLGINGLNSNNKVIDFKTLFGSDSNLLIEQLHYALNDKVRSEILNHFFLERIKQVPNYIETRLISVIKLMGSLQSKPTIGVISDKLCLSYRTVERLFANEIGLNVIDYLKIIRMNKAFILLKDKKETGFSNVFSECGYYDQSHFIKDFKSYTGRTPVEFITNKSGSFYFDRPYLIL